MSIPSGYQTIKLGNPNADLHVISTEKDIYKSDKKLSQRIKEYASLDQKCTAWKTTAKLLSVLPIFKMLSEMCNQKAERYQDQIDSLLNSAKTQFDFDRSRKYTIKINGKDQEHASQLIETLTTLKVSNVRQYTILQLAQQGGYATVSKSVQDQLLSFSKKEKPSSIPNCDYKISYPEATQNQTFEITIKKDTSLIDSKIIWSTSHYTHDGYVNVLVLPTIFRIDLDSGRMRVAHALMDANQNDLERAEQLVFGERDKVDLREKSESESPVKHQASTTDLLESRAVE